MASPWQTHFHCFKHMEATMGWGIIGDIGNAVSSGANWVANKVEDGANWVAGAVSDGVDAIGNAGSAIGSAVGSGAKEVIHLGDSAVSSVFNGAHKVVDLGVHEITAVGKTIGSAAVNVGDAFIQDGASAFRTVTHGASEFVGELGNTANGVVHAIGHLGSSLGNGVIHTAEHIGSTAGKLGGDIIHTAGTVAGDVAHGVDNLAHGNLGDAAKDLGHAGSDLADGAGKTATDLAHGVVDVAKDAGQAAKGAGEAVVEGGAAVATGVVEMGGTAAGVAGELAKDYEHSMGTLVVNAVDVVGAVAKAEVAIGYGAAGIAAETVGGPAGDFYANVAKEYGNAAIATLDHLQHAINNAVDKGTNAVGDLANTSGHSADTLGHDSGKVIDDISRGDFDAAAHDLAQLGKDAFQAAKDYAGAQVEGAEALGAMVSAVGAVLGGLNEAMGRAGGGFVKAVGETIGGDAGDALVDTGDVLAKATEMTAALVQGDYAGAAKAGAKELGGLGGEWLGDHVKDGINKLGDEVGGIAGDGIKALADPAADGLKGAGKSLAGAAADKGFDAIKGDDHAPTSDGHGDKAPTDKAENHESLIDKGLHALGDAKDHAIDKATDIFEKATHDPNWLLTQGADMVKDHFGKGAADALGKLLAVTDGSHAHADAGTTAHAAEGSAIGTTHSALTAAPSGNNFWEQASHGDGHILDAATQKGDLAHALSEGTAASAVANAPIPVLESHSLVPSFGAGDSVESMLGNHASWSAMSQSLPHAGFDAAGAFGGHEAMHVHQQMPHFDHAMPAHFELMLDSHFAHHPV
jgi:hypothetical protein